MFELKSNEAFVTIGSTKYEGTVQIDTILSTNFTVAFQSGLIPVSASGDSTYVSKKGILLYWSCTQWGEWEPLDNGNCGLVKRPSDNGTMTTGLLKYKVSETCSK